MKEVFMIASFDVYGNIHLKNEAYPTYQNAVDALANFPKGTYQIQKVFVVS